MESERVVKGLYRNREAQLDDFRFLFLGGCEEAALMSKPSSELILSPCLSTVDSDQILIGSQFYLTAGQLSSYVCLLYVIVQAGLELT